MTNSLPPGPLPRRRSRTAPWFAAVAACLGLAAIPTRLAAASSGSITNDLVLYLPFNGDTLDASARGNHGTLVGKSDFRAGLAGQAIHLGTSRSGGTNYVRLGHPPDLLFGNATHFTISGWIKPAEDRLSGWQLLSYGLESTPTFLIVAGAELRDGEYGVAGGFKNESGRVTSMQSSVMVQSPRQWTHVAMVVQRQSRADLYVNGEPVATSGLAGFDGSLDGRPGTDWCIAQDANGAQPDVINTLVDEMAVWRRALSASEVKSLYRFGMAGLSLDQIDQTTAVELGALDTTFDPGLGVESGVVYALAYQPDAKLLVAGRFTQFDGLPRPDIARLNTDGTVDSSFTPFFNLGNDDAVFSIALQPDGKVIIGGLFHVYDSTSFKARQSVLRLNTDGTLDSTFDPPELTSPDGGAAAVLSVAVQADGKILLGGDIGKADTRRVSHVIRLQTNGAIDTRFNPEVVRRDILVPISKVIASPLGIYLAGNFKEVNGKKRYSIARLNYDGSLDTDYASDGTGPSQGSVFGGLTAGSPKAAVLSPDGQLIVGGVFTSVGSTPVKTLARFNEAGLLDTSFQPDVSVTASLFGNTPSIDAMALHPDGGIVIGGDFDTVNGRPSGSLAHLSMDGQLVANFRPGLEDKVRALAFRCDSMLAAGGDFNFLRGVRRNRVAQIHTQDPSLSCLCAPEFNAAGLNRIGSRVTPRKSYVLQQSGDLVTWTTVRESSVGTANFFFWQNLPTDPRPARFFRLLQK